MMVIGEHTTIRDPVRMRDIVDSSDVSLTFCRSTCRAWGIPGCPRWTLKVSASHGAETSECHMFAHRSMAESRSLKDCGIDFALRFEEVIRTRQP